MATAVSTTQSRLLNGDKVTAGVVEEYEKKNWFTQNLPMVPVVSSVSPGAGWAFVYNRESTDPAANTRQVGADYTSVAAEVSQHTVVMSILGRKFDIDTALADQGAGAEIVHQLAQAAKATGAKFSDLVVNGDSGNAGEFDGIVAAVAGTDNTVNGAALDLTVIDTAAEANAFLFQLDNLLSLVRGGDRLAILTNRQGALRLRQVTRLAGVSSVAEVRGSSPIDAYAGIPIVDLGSKSGSNDPIVGIATNTEPDPDVTGASDIIVVALGEDAFHGIYPAGRDLFKVTQPDFATAASVASGRVEMVASAVLKNTKGAAVLKNVKVA